MHEKVPHWLSQQAHISPNKTAIELIDNTKLTFLQLQRKSESFARKLATLGVNKNTKVAILSPNHVDMITAIHALSYLGAIVVLLNTRLTKSELLYQIEHAGVTLVLSTPQLQEEKELQGQIIKTISSVKEVDEMNIVLNSELNLAEPFTMMYTSGTTGVPKAVIHSYGNHWWSAVGSALNLGLSKDDKWLATLPIFHVGGLSIFLRSVIYGTTAFLMEAYDEKIAFQIIKEKKITIVSFVTLMLQQFIDSLGAENIPNNLRTILLGGGSVPENLLNKVKDKEIPLIQSYGMTETSSQIITLSNDDALRKLGSAGKALFPASIKINKRTDEQVGEIFVKGPMVMNGYFNNDKANKESFENGWLKTGDLGYIDDEGFLYVVDRRTDLIISGGENIYPSEVEKALMEVNGVVEAVVVGKADDKWGMIPIAFIVRKSVEISVEEIMQRTKTHLATFKIPKEIHFIERMPRNASNKIMRHKLRELLVR